MGQEEKQPEILDKVDPGKKKEEPSKDEKTPKDAKNEEKKPEDSKENNPPPPPPPPPEIVLRVYMHCEGCARKVRRCLKGFDGVEGVETNCRTSKVVVKGEKADPVKVLERIQRKSHRQVELISPLPKPPSEDQPKKPEEKPALKIEVKKEELPVITVVLRVYMHCEACAQEIKKRILRMKGVESAEPELKSSQVTVKGAFLAEKLADYVYKRTGKHATIVKVEPEKKEAEKKGKEGKEEKKAEEKEKEVTKSEEPSKEGKETKGEEAAPAVAVVEEDLKQWDMKRNEYFYDNMNYSYNHLMVNNPPLEFHVQEYYNYRPDQRLLSPQIFSDENPNACSVM